MNVIVSNNDNAIRSIDSKIGRHMPCKTNDQYYEFFKLLLIDYFTEKIGDDVEDICLNIPNCFLEFNLHEVNDKNLCEHNYSIVGIKKDLFIKYFQTRFYVRNKTPRSETEKLCNEFLEIANKTLI